MGDHVRIRLQTRGGCSTRIHLIGQSRLWFKMRESWSAGPVHVKRLGRALGPDEIRILLRGGAGVAKGDDGGGTFEMLRRACAARRIRARAAIAGGVYRLMFDEPGTDRFLGFVRSSNTPFFGVFACESPTDTTLAGRVLAATL